MYLLPVFIMIHMLVRLAGIVSSVPKVLLLLTMKNVLAKSAVQAIHSISSMAEISILI